MDDSIDDAGIAKVVPVVIPYFRAPEALEKNLECIKKQKKVSTEIFVRDNSSDNILFTRAVNQGLRKYCYSDDYEFVLILNQDAYLHEECLLNMVLVMQSWRNAGICAPISLSGGDSVNWCGSADAYPWGRHLFCRKEALKKKPYETYWANGACMLLRTAMVREIGLLDENMKFICSDSDYSFTARSRGWKVMVVPNAFISHESGGSSDIVNNWLNRRKFEDQLYFARKWLTGGIYRELACEGPKLTAAEIDKNVRATQAAIDAYDDLGVP